MHNRLSTSDPLALVEQAHDVFRDVLTKVTPDQLRLPTPSDGWDVQALVSHVVYGNRWAAAFVRDGNASWPEDDAIGDRAPLDVYQESVDAMLAAFNEPGALERTVTLRSQEIPAVWFVNARFGELIHHAWDLAKATGQNTDLAPELSELALATARQQMDDMDRGAHMQFKAEGPVPADAPAADRLAAYLGKQV